MRCIIAMRRDRTPPMIEMYIHGAPHRRQHLAVLQNYRAGIIAAADLAKIKHPIDYPVDISVVFINPSSPDLDNLLAALYRALDGKTLTMKQAGLLVDDGLIQKATVSKYYPT